MPQINLVGRKILGYTVSEKLGSGAFGTVYKAVKINPAGQYVRALKHITIPTEKQYISVLNSMGGDASKADNYFSEMLKGIVSEINILNDLSENGVEHIVRYYENDIEVTDSPRRYDIYILMEYLTPLEDFIQSNSFTVNDVVNLGLDVLRGLRSCHEHGVIHRDIKDDNIFVSSKGEYKIGDFGISKVLKDSSRAESLKGTLNFLAPEVYLGKEGYTKSVDLYSLGIVLYRLLNIGRNPFLPHFPDQYYAQDEDTAFEKRMSGKKPDFPSLGGEEIGNVIVRAISNSVERFQSAEEFLAALEQAVNKTDRKLLNQTVKFDIIPQANTVSDAEKRAYASTIGETPSQLDPDPHTPDGDVNSINQHLFDSIGGPVISDIPEIETDTGNSKGTSADRDSRSEPKGKVVDAVSVFGKNRFFSKLIEAQSLRIVAIVLLLGIVIWISVFHQSQNGQNQGAVTTGFDDTTYSSDMTQKDGLGEDDAAGVSLIPLNGTPGFIGEGFENLFDGNPYTKWCIPFHGSAYVIWKMSEPVVVDCLSVRSANDNSKCPGRNPAAFTFLGSENDETYENGNWTVLYIRNPTALSRHDEEDFFLEVIEMPKNFPAFQYYKVEFTEITGPEIMQLSELEVNFVS